VTPAIDNTPPPGEYFANENQGAGLMSRSICEVAPLETRRLYAAAPKITSFYADNRGEMAVVFDRFMLGTNSSAVTVTQAGNDGNLGTGDDQVVSDVFVSFNAVSNRMTIRANTLADRDYRVQLNASVLTSGKASGRRALDGEFVTNDDDQAVLPSGDGKAGGNFVAIANADDSDRPQIRINTTLGAINMRLLKDLAPNSVANFLAYANSGRYDGTFFTRSARDFIVQGGGLRIRERDDELSVVQDLIDAGIAEEALAQDNSNLDGTIAFARSGPNNLATNQFFFNLSDNTQLDDESDFEDTFYTPFARPVGDADEAVIENLGNRQRADFSDEIKIEIPGGVDQLPVAEGGNGVALSNVIQIRRAAVRMIASPQ
jgi:cyclophilin family peptidyl-prolyl cis-trans isomerase